MDRKGDESVVSPELQQRRNCVDATRDHFDFSIFAITPDISMLWRDPAFEQRYGKKLLGIEVAEGERPVFSTANPQFNFRVATAASEVVQDRYQPTLADLTAKEDTAGTQLLEEGRRIDLTKKRSLADIKKDFDKDRWEVTKHAINRAKLTNGKPVIQCTTSGDFLLVQNTPERNIYEVLSIDALYAQSPDNVEAILASHYENQLLQDFIKSAVTHLAYHGYPPRTVINIGIEDLPEATRVVREASSDESALYLLAVTLIKPEVYEYLRQRSTSMRLNTTILGDEYVNPNDYLDHMDICPTVLLPDQVYVHAAKNIYDAINTRDPHPSLAANIERAKAEEIALLRNPLRFTDTYINYQVGRLLETNKEVQTITTIIDLLQTFTTNEAFLTTLSEQMPEFYEKLTEFKTDMGEANFTSITEQGWFLTQDTATLRNQIGRALSRMGRTEREKKWVSVYDQYSQHAQGFIVDREIAAFLPLYTFVLSGAGSESTLMSRKHAVQEERKQYEEELDKNNGNIANYDAHRAMMRDFLHEKNISREDCEAVADMTTRKEIWKDKEILHWDGDRFYMLFSALWLSVDTGNASFRATMKMAFPYMDFTVLDKLPSKQAKDTE